MRYSKWNFSSLTQKKKTALGAWCWGGVHSRALLCPANTNDFIEHLPRSRSHWPQIGQNQGHSIITKSRALSKPPVTQQSPILARSGHWYFTSDGIGLASFSLPSTQEFLKDLIIKFPPISDSIQFRGKLHFLEPSLKSPNKDLSPVHLTLLETVRCSPGCTFLFSVSPNMRFASTAWWVCDWSTLTSINVPPCTNSQVCI